MNIPKIARITLNILLSVVYWIIILMAVGLVCGFSVGAMSIDSDAADALYGIMTVLSTIGWIISLIVWRKSIYITK